MKPRGLRVPGRRVGLEAAADRDRLGRLAERDDPLLAVAVAEQQERVTPIQRRLAFLELFGCLTA